MIAITTRSSINVKPPLGHPPERSCNRSAFLRIGEWMDSLGFMANGCLLNRGTGSCEPANTCDYLPFLKTTVKKKMERLTVSVIKDVMVKYFSEFEPRITPKRHGW